MKEGFRTLGGYTSWLAFIRIYPPGAFFWDGLVSGGAWRSRYFSLIKVLTFFSCPNFSGNPQILLCVELIHDVFGLLFSGNIHFWVFSVIEKGCASFLGQVLGSYEE